MSKANRKTTTLRTKSATRRTARSAKRRNRTTCPVAELARKIDNLAKQINYVRQRIANEAAGSQDKEHWQQRLDTLYDQVRSYRTCASFLVPRSMEGVLLLLGSIDTDADSMRDSENKWHRAGWHRRLQRSLYGIVRYLDSAHGTNSGGGLYLHDDPLVHVM